ncbi:retrovirus-related Pol polyprotein from transposon 17.6 [Trichonephila clavipes]|uniref:Retrovirus-related Pol polyprotein from transposon 17.6 n=1 Tax=Trichonephila clavipes TaxID=2585209 RepID=A0A8X6V6P2_TRICX|nr:retrovirus-related Pol polyprotein from transposon 17.6 [Trichonephila clavipes]
MAAIDFLHHENTPTWAGIEPATLGAEGQRQTYHATQRAHNGLIKAYRFAVDYRKLNTITKHPRYPLPLIEYLITNIPHTTIMSSLDLHSGYFELAVNRSDVVKAAFVTKNGTYAFIRMPFGLLGG